MDNPHIVLVKEPMVSDAPNVRATAPMEARCVPNSESSKPIQVCGSGGVILEMGCYCVVALLGALGGWGVKGFLG